MRLNIVSYFKQNTQGMRGLMDAIERRIIALIDENREVILAFAEDIRLHPESGYREFRTAGKLADFFRRMGLPTVEGLAVTGVRAVLGREFDSAGEPDSAREFDSIGEPDSASEFDSTGEPDSAARQTPGKKPDAPVGIAILGELDGVRCDSHPDADPKTGIAHACGHHAQLGALVGAALALCDPLVSAALDGKVTFLGVPAEEGVDGEWKQHLKNEGKIVLLSGGKAELVRLGAFDGIDAVLAHHVHFAETDADILLGNGSTNGYVAKTIKVHGKAAHAGSKPHEGVNALNAASLGLTALAYHRETFRDEDSVRIHGMITQGGTAVNVVPSEVVVEVMVRAKNLDAIHDAGCKTDRSFRYAALALGAEAEVTDLPGYLPVIGSLPDSVQIKAAALLGDGVDSRAVDLARHNPLSTDIGDLTHLLPVLHVTSGGFSGNLHGADFHIADPETTILVPAKIHALTAYRLLKDGAAEALRIREQFIPVLTKEDYLAQMGLLTSET